MPSDWVKIYRTFQEWEWYSKSEMVHLFLHLLLNASASERKWNGIKIQRGQIVTSRKDLNEETGISEQTIRTCLSRLVECGEITKKSTNKFTILTICNYDEYVQGEPETIVKEPEPQHQQEPSVVETPKEEPKKPKKPKKTKAEVVGDTEKRKASFYNSLVPFVQTYGKEMVREFYDYWSEINKSGSRMRWEQETTWELDKRLSYWSRRNKSYSKSNGTVNTGTTTKEDRAREAAEIIARLAAEEQ